MVNIRRPKVTDLQRLIRIGVSIPLFLLLIVVWTYLVIKASAPKIKKVTDHEPTMFSLDPEDVFCAREPAPVTEPINKGGTCKDGFFAVESKCTPCTPVVNASSDSSVSGLSCTTATNSQVTGCPPGYNLIKASDTHNQNADTCVEPCPESHLPGKPTPTRLYCTAIKTNHNEFTCNSDQYTNDESWCPSPTEPDLTLLANKDLLNSKYVKECCKDKEPHPNINYVGLTVFIVVKIIY